MKYSLELASPTPTGWVKTVLADFPAFLQDHADCERKASAMAMSFVAKYPDRVDIIPELIATAIEELGHFQQVYAHMQKRHIRLAKEMRQDPYIQSLLDLCRTDPLHRFLDRLLLASIIECRGAERFRLVREAVENDAELKVFYHRLWQHFRSNGLALLRGTKSVFATERTERSRRENGSILGITSGSSLGSAQK